MSAARATAFLATGIIIITGVGFLLEPSWAAILTGVGALLGFYSLWLTLEIYRIGDYLSREQGKVLAGQLEVIDEVHRSVMAALKFQHLHDLRRKYDDSEKDEEKRRYWEFSWRFESFDFLTLRIGDDGWARIRVRGSNNQPLNTNADSVDLPIYSVDVFEVKNCDGLNLGRAYCWCPSGRMRISNNADEFTVRNPSFEFSISGLGPIRVNNVSERPPNYLRLKDLQTPTGGDTDQG